MRLPIFPDQASTMAEQVDWLYFFLTALTLFFLAIIALPIAFFALKYRHTRYAERSQLNIAQWKLELSWTLIPLFLTLVIFGWGALLYFRMQRAPADAMEIVVVGKQWMWKLQHAQGNREINELHVPTGRNVKLTMVSQDVIHSFFLPVFRIKQDVLPNRYTTQWFRATKPGTYHLFCAEYCGTEHSGMIGRLVVMNPPDYEDWLARGDVQEPLVAAGARLFRELGCSGCHAPNAQIRAPLLEGLFGKPVPLASGEVVVADMKYVRDSILLPQSQITAGYEDVMPTFEGRLSEEQLFQLIAYIKSLAQERPMTPQ